MRRTSSSPRNCARERADAHDHRHLRQLRGLELEHAEVEPALVALDVRPERREHGQQHDHGAEVDEHRPVAQVVVVDEGHHTPGDGAEHDEQQLLGGERVVVRGSGATGGAEHHEQSEHGHAPDRREQHPVDVRHGAAGRAAARPWADVPSARPSVRPTGGVGARRGRLTRGARLGGGGRALPEDGRVGNAARRHAARDRGRRGGRGRSVVAVGARATGWWGRSPGRCPWRPGAGTAGPPPVRRSRRRSPPARRSPTRPIAGSAQVRSPTNQALSKRSWRYCAVPVLPATSNFVMSMLSKTPAAVPPGFVAPSKPASIAACHAGGMSMWPTTFGTGR